MDELLKMLSGMGVGVVNAVPSLALQLPTMLEQMATQAGGPVVGQMLASVVTPMYSQFLNSITGTSKSDVRISDLMGAYTTRSIEHRIRSRKATREFGEIPDTYSAEQAQASVDTLYRAVYGDTEDINTARDSVGYKFLKNIFTQAHEKSTDAAEGLLGYAAANRIKIAGVDFGTTGQYSEDKNKLASEIATHIDEMLYGKVDAKGNLVASSITGSLSADELERVLTDAVKAGMFSGGANYSDNRRNIESYVQKIAQGIDNIKGAFGGNLTAAQAQGIVSGLYGFDVSKMSASAFSGIARDLNRVARLHGIAQEDLFGDEKSGKVGSLSIINEMAKGTTLSRHVQQRLGIMLAADTKDRSSGMWGVDAQQLSGQRMITDELTGYHQNVAVALTYWASEQGLDARNLTAKQLEQFRKATSNVNFRDADAVNRFTKGSYNALAGSDLVKATAGANASLFIALDKDSQNRIYKQNSESLLQELNSIIGSDVSKQLGDIHGQSVTDLEQKIASMKGITDDQRSSALQAIQRSRNLLQYAYNLSWMSNDTRRGDTTITDADGNIKLTATGVQGVTQYLTAAGTKATYHGAIRAFFGLSADASDSDVQKAIDKNPDAIKQVQAQFAEHIKSPTTKDQAGKPDNTAKPQQQKSSETTTPTASPAPATTEARTEAATRTSSTNSETDWEKVAQLMGKEVANNLRETLQQLANYIKNHELTSPEKTPQEP